MSTNLENPNPIDARAWLERHGNYLYCYAFARLRNSSLSEQLLEETLVTGMGSPKTFSSYGCERSWLLGILSKRIRDRYRRPFTHRDLSSQNSEPGELEFFENTGEWTAHWREAQAPVLWTTDPQQLGKSPGFWETFDRCLSFLSEVAANAFTLREIDGLPPEEICEILNVSETDLRVILHEARLKLRRSLEVEWFHSGHKSPRTQCDEEAHEPETRARQSLPEVAKKYFATET